MPYLGQQRVLLPGVQSSDLTTGKVKSGRGKDALAQSGMDALATFVVPSGGVSSITFGGIPQGYSHIEIYGMVRTNRSDKTDDVTIRFNNDSGSNYSTHLIGVVNTGASPYSYNGTNGNVIFHYEGFPGSTLTADCFGAAMWTITDYAKTNKYKTLRSVHGFDSNGDSKSLVQLNSGNWRSFEPINSITIAPSYGTGFVQHSHFALYGIK